MNIQAVIQKITHHLSPDEISVLLADLNKDSPQTPDLLQDAFNAEQTFYYEIVRFLDSIVEVHGVENVNEDNPFSGIPATASFTKQLSELSVSEIQNVLVRTAIHPIGGNLVVEFIEELYYHLDRANYELVLADPRLAAYV